MSKEKLQGPLSTVLALNPRSYRTSDSSAPHVSQVAKQGALIYIASNASLRLVGRKKNFSEVRNRFIFCSSHVFHFIGEIGHVFTCLIEIIYKLNPEIRQGYYQNNGIFMAKANVRTCSLCLQNMHGMKCNPKCLETSIVYLCSSGESCLTPYLQHLSRQACLSRLLHQTTDQTTE